MVSRCWTHGCSMLRKCYDDRKSKLDRWLVNNESMSTASQRWTKSKSLLTSWCFDSKSILTLLRFGGGVDVR